jgi:hypothetical protein
MESWASKSVGLSYIDCYELVWMELICERQVIMTNTIEFTYGLF